MSREASTNPGEILYRFDLLASPNNVMLIDLLRRYLNSVKDYIQSGAFLGINVFFCIFGAVRFPHPDLNLATYLNRHSSASTSTLSEAFYSSTLPRMKLENSTNWVAPGKEEMNSPGIMDILVHLQLGHVNGQLKQVNYTPLVVA